VSRGATPQFRLQSRRLVGNELRVLLETAIRYRTFTSHSSKAASAKGWLITVDLSKNGLIGKRARVIGPLWDVPGERSELSFTAGANFTQQDVAAARATPFIDFDADGTPIRIRSDPKEGNGMIRERLILGAKPFWKLDGPFLPLPPPGPPMNEETVETLSGRYHLQLVDAKVTLHERLTGKRIPDPWLEAAFKECRGIKDFENVRMSLTDDLKYLVASPEPIWNGVHTSTRTFDWGGKTYRRGEYGLVWKRPQPGPTVFKKPKNEDGPVFERIDQAPSIDGKLYFLYREGTLAWLGIDANQELVAGLVPFSEGPAYHVHPPRDRIVQWCQIGRQQRQQLAKPTRLVFFGTNDIVSRHAPDHIADRALVVFIWNLDNATLTIHDAATGELFERQNGEYVPKHSTTVE
jgi:hypothetical protein